jgi:hypothetical protein
MSQYPRNVQAGLYVLVAVGRRSHMGECRDSRRHRARLR